MLDVILILIIFLSALIGLIMFAVSIASSVDERAPKGTSLGFLIISILCIGISISSYFWFSAGGCKYDGYEYINVQRNGDLKFYTYNGYIRQLDKTFNDKEYKIKLHKWSNQWCYGVYHTSKPSIILEFVPIAETEVEKK